MEENNGFLLRVRGRESWGSTAAGTAGGEGEVDRITSIGSTTGWVAVNCIAAAGGTEYGWNIN